MNTAAKVRIEKQNHPERFCASPKCLWRVVTPRGPNPCQRHPVSTQKLTETAAGLCGATVVDGLDLMEQGQYEAMLSGLGDAWVADDFGELASWMANTWFGCAE